MEELAFIFRIIAFAVFNFYIIGVVSRYGVRKSISDSDYFMEKPWKWLFEFTMFISGISVALTGEAENNLVMLIGGICLFFVGIFSDFKRSKFMKVIHVTVAILGLGLSILSLLPTYWYFVLGIIISLFLIIWWTFKNKKEKVIIWNIEIILSYGIFISLNFIVKL